jgi:hypothetical protein
MLAIFMLFMAVSFLLVGPACAGFAVIGKQRLAKGP